MPNPPLCFIPIGGVGSSQLRTVTTGMLWWKIIMPGIIDALRALPGVKIFENSGWAEHMGGGIWEFIAANPDSLIYLCGHSLGVDTAIHTTAAATGRVAGMTLISPVWNQKPQPNCPTLVFKPTSSCFPQAEVGGIDATVIPDTDHNTITHNPRVITAIVSDVAKRRDLRIVY